MRYYRTDPTPEFPSGVRVAYFDGGANSTRTPFGIARYIGTGPSGVPTDYARPVSPGTAARIARGGGPTVYRPGSTVRTGRPGYRDIGTRGPSRAEIARYARAIGFDR